jgi:hypothetical protein
MKKIALFLGLIGIVLNVGCASVQMRPNALQVTITPEQIYPGCVVSAEVIAPPGTREVQGRLDFWGSPVIPLKTKDSGITWTFVTQIPLDAVWEPGKYRIVVNGIAGDGSRVQGEAWIMAR